MSLALGAALKEIKCKYDEDGLHNAGNDATYTIYAILLLGIRSSQARSLHDDELARLHQLRTFVQKVGLERCQEPVAGGHSMQNTLQSNCAVEE